jgi:hypothetical protein
MNLPGKSVSVTFAGQCKRTEPGVLKQLDSIYHDIFDHHQKPASTVIVPSVSL